MEGPILVGEAMAAGIELVTVFSTEHSPAVGDAERILVTPQVLAHLADTVTPQGPVAVIRIPPIQRVTRDHLVLEVGDPGNAGTLIRTAAAFGMEVVVRTGAVDPWSPKVLRAASGAHFRTVLGTAPENSGTIATVVDGGVGPDELSGVLDPSRIWAILVGSEPHGLAPDDVQRADVRVSIPMPGSVESLNAAVAGGIVAYELMRWRRRVGASPASR